jgi:hypothetical protein
MSQPLGWIPQQLSGSSTHSGGWLQVGPLHNAGYHYPGWCLICYDYKGFVGSILQHTTLTLGHCTYSCAGGRVVVASIHQPASRLYQEMDSVGGRERGMQVIQGCRCRRLPGAGCEAYLAYASICSSHDAIPVASLLLLCAAAPAL